jgi:hypothetical protein
MVAVSSVAALVEAQRSLLLVIAEDYWARSYYVLLHQQEEMRHLAEVRQL